jgi:AcrR family transcriptional regulator
LLDAAVTVFALHGYHAARVDDIVKRAATSHGTFYLYFASKEDLFWTLTADVAAKMSGLVHSLERLDAGRSGRAALRDWIERFADLYQHYGPVIRAWTEAETDTSAFGQLGHRIFGDVASAFGDRIATSPAAGIDPGVASLALLAMVERLNYYVMSGQLAADRGQTIDLLTTVAHRSLFGASAGPDRNANRRSPRTRHAVQ